MRLGPGNRTQSLDSDQEMKKSIWLIAGLLVGITAFGCGDNSGPPQSIATQEQVTNLVEARKIFDASDKNFDALSAEQKAEFVKLAGGGDETKARNIWNSMLNPRGGGPGPAGPGG